MSDKKQNTISTTQEKKEKSSPAPQAIVKTLEFRQLCKAILEQNTDKFSQTIDDALKERKKQKNGSEPPIIQIIQFALHQAIRDNQDIKPFLLLDCIKKKESLLEELAAYAVKQNKPQAISPIITALQHLKVHVDSLAIGDKSPIPLINWSIQQPGYSDITLKLLEVGSKTYTLPGLNYAQQHISKPLEDMGDFPSSLELAIKHHDPEKNDQSEVISIMIDRATAKDISGSINLLDAFILNKKDRDFAIMKQLLNKSGEAPILAALGLLKKTQNLQGYFNKDALRDFILTCISEERHKPSWKKQLGAACMKLAKELKEQDIINAVQQTGIPPAIPSVWDSLVNHFFSSNTSNPSDDKSESLLSLSGTREKSFYGGTDSSSRLGPGFSINDKD